MTDSVLDEIAFAGSEHLDVGYVAGYDRKAGFDPGADVDALRARGLGHRSTLVDYGAGTGTFALAAAAFCRRVVAVDVSPAMVEAMHAKVAATAAANVECVQAGFLSYEHQGPAPDFVYSRNALHHLPDFWKGIALRRIESLLAPGGTLQLRDLVFSFDLAEAEARIAAWLDSSVVERSEEGWTRSELEAHLRDEHSTFTWLLEPLFERAGFEVVHAEYGSVGAYANYICVKRAIDAR
jgi:SAM-dependent methyltransferase